jgi:diguanylate cyclase (GGDEF)-like protein
MNAGTGIRDVVTGLYVREYFDDVIARELERSRRHGIALSVVSVVLVNSAEVAEAGEEAIVAVLAETATELQRIVRETDHLFRWEADEFLALLFEADADACVPVRVRVGGATHEEGLVFPSVLQAARATARPAPVSP